MERLKKIFTLKNLLKAVSIGASISLALSYLSPFIHPESWSLIPLFGLAYPVIFIIHLLLTTTWLFISKRCALGMAILIIIGGNLHFRTFTIGSGDDPNGAEEVKVLSYNVHLFDRYNPNPNEADNNRDKIIQFLDKEDADIMCFQEFYHQDQPTTFVTKDTILKLLDTKDYHERYAHVLKGRQNFGISMFSKYPMVQKGEIVFPGKAISFNYCIFADIKTPEGIIRVYNVHLQSIRLNSQDNDALDSPDSDQKAKNSSGMFWIIGKVMGAYPLRGNQTDCLMKHIRKSPYPVVVCGDFNDTPMSYTYSQFNSELTDAFRNSCWGIGNTYAGSLPAGRIDYMFHSSSLGSRNFIIQDEKLSDHYAITCSIFKKRE